MGTYYQPTIIPFIFQDFVLVYFAPSLSDAGAARLSKVFCAVLGAIIMALTWVASQLGGVLSAALALFGAIGGPLLGLFILGIFVPFANSVGAIVGVLSGLGLSLWMTVGAHIYKVGVLFSEVRAKPSSIK